MFLIDNGDVQYIVLSYLKNVNNILRDSYSYRCDRNGRDRSPQ
jgi:hypothetical protein